MFYGPKPTKSYVARTRHFWRRVGVGHRNGYDSPDSGVRRVSSSFFFRFSDTRRRSANTAPTQLRRGSDASDTPAVKKKRKFRHISGHSGQFRPKWKFRPIQDFDWKKIKKIKIKILPPPSGFRAFLPPHLLLNVGLFFFLFFFFFFFWFRSATWLPLLLYLCVLAVLHLCLEFRL